MKNMFAVAIVAALSVSAAAHASGPVESNKTVRVEMPCVEPGFHVPACAVESSLVNSDSPMATVNLDVSAAKAFQGKTSAFMIIHSYQVKPGGPNSDVGATVNQGQHSIIADLHTNKPVLFWTITKDGGRTWTKMATNETGVISY